MFEKKRNYQNKFTFIFRFSNFYNFFRRELQRYRHFNINRTAISTHYTLGKYSLGDLPPIIYQEEFYEISFGQKHQINRFLFVISDKFNNEFSSNWDIYLLSYYFPTVGPWKHSVLKFHFYINICVVFKLLFALYYMQLSSIWKFHVLKWKEILYILYIFFNVLDTIFADCRKTSL